MAWLNGYADAARQTDRFADSAEHVALLAAGLMGEAGSILTELKKEKRERDAYPAYRHRMQEEIGDSLWYFVRLCDVTVPGLLAELQPRVEHPSGGRSEALALFLEFGGAVGDILNGVRGGDKNLRPLLARAWDLLQAIAQEANLDLPSVAATNTRKTESRWPVEKLYAPLFDEDFVEEEQLPRHLEMEFRERQWGQRHAVILRCNGMNFGDRLTDSIQDPDGYRYHDIFHFAYAVHLGWSPVVRALLRCKRKSSPEIDEAQDGARAGIIDEAVSAIIFSRAKQLNFFAGLGQVDYDLLKTVTEFVRGYEVERVPLWQWEAAILDGYATFRKLRSNCGGRVILDLEKRRLTCIAPP